MEVYERNTVKNGSLWGLELMRGLGFGSNEIYPERYGVQSCVYYMRNGVCGYGTKCRYSHPRDRRTTTAPATSIYRVEDYPERVGEPECQFYLKNGNCKFGASCKFHHPMNAGGPVPLNVYGFPLRSGEKECTFYMKTGQCKFGIACKFHHPPVAGSTPVNTPPSYPEVQSPLLPVPEQFGAPATIGKVSRPPLLPGSYVKGTYGPVPVSPGVVPIQGWIPYSGPMRLLPSPGAQHLTGTGSLYGVAHVSSRPYPTVQTCAESPGSILKEYNYPERPGQPECQFYLKTGDCKFRSSCRFHHPHRWVVPPSSSVLSPLGLPMRPGVQPCTFYLLNGQCKFGLSCKFDHPVMIRYSPSASSLANMPIVPCPIGSSITTLAPSISASDFRQQQ